MKLYVFSASTAHLLHFIFEWLAIAIGVQLYRRQRAYQQQAGILAPGHYGVIIGCVLGAAIGNKAAFWMEFPHMWAAATDNLQILMSGQSIVGGLLGGLIGVEFAKYLLKQPQSTGDNFVLPLMVATVIGRIGCFLAGLNDGTYGNATGLPWGIDFGDGIARHPTQIYDMIFVLAWGSYLWRYRQAWQSQSGLMFKMYLAGYLFWRLLVDGIKPVPYYYFSYFSGIQILCIIALVIYLPLLVRQMLRLNTGEKFGLEP
ncbi:prolipoprotein diacylglyceryl transferase family protein [Undibacterium sp. TC4M20W]|uniref:prolipoprotein diacylglyceryl transferase family protein n=1 Tax=Undibacterium sp. TC4M20W TaxID=3413052 RepID=UPI003BF0D37D